MKGPSHSCSHTHRLANTHKRTNTQASFRRCRRGTGDGAAECVLRVTDHLSDTAFYESRLQGTNLSTVVYPAHFSLRNKFPTNTFWMHTDKHKQMNICGQYFCLPIALFSCQNTKTSLRSKKLDSTACIMIVCVCVCRFLRKHTFTDLLSDLGLHLLHLQ